MNGYGTKIGVHAELAPQAKQSLLGTQFRSGIVPPGATDRTEQNGVGRSAQLDRFGRQWSAARIECAATNQSLRQLDVVAEALRDRAENPRAFGDDLRSDTIAGKERDF